MKIKSEQQHHKNLTGGSLKQSTIADYLESEPDSNFAINSASNFDSFDSASKSDESESESKSDFSSVLMNLDICIFSTYIYTLLLTLTLTLLFLSILITESIVVQAMQV